MRLEKVSIRGFGPFADFSVDLSEYGNAKLLAVTGPNGAGKSTMLELGLPGAMFRSTPTRGSLASLATTRDAVLEARVHNGRSWTLRHVVDAQNGKAEAVVLDEEGNSALDSSKVRDFDAWAAQHLPPPEVLFASVFAPQGAAGFLGAKPADRKSVLLRVLGIERYEAFATDARERARDAKAELATVQARLADERARGGDLRALEVEAQAAIEGVGLANGALSKAREDLAEAEAEARRVEALRAEQEAALAQCQELEQRAADTDKRVADLDVRLANNRALLDEAGAIRDATEALDAERARLAMYQEQVQAAELVATEHRAEVRRLEVAITAANAGHQEALERAARARARLAKQAEVDAAAATIPGLRTAVETAEAEATEARAEMEALCGRRLAGAKERIGALRRGLEWVATDASNLEEARANAEECLGEDNEVIRRATALPAEVSRAEVRLEPAEGRLLDARRALSDAERIAAQKASFAPIEEELDAAERHARDTLTQRDDMAFQLEGMTPPEPGPVNELASTRERIADLEPQAARLGRLEAAEARLAELQPQADTARAELAKLHEQLEGLAPEAPLPEAPSLEGAKRAVAAAEKAAQESHTVLAKAEQSLEQAKASAARATELQAAQAAVEAELADWIRLAGDLGKDGLQAIEIDAAGPELTELTNDLLHSCHGPRFTVRVETQRLASDKKRMLEGCDVMVIDSERGREAAGETFSGGERVIIGEALSLALSMLACRHAGLERPTLVRDESGAALDPVAARAYVAMLRRAAELVDADKVLFVSHSQDVIDMADAQIEVKGSESMGEVTQ